MVTHGFSGSGATGVARNCDFLAEALSVISSETVVKCVLDGPPDMAPVWLQQSLPQEQCEGAVSEAGSADCRHLLNSKFSAGVRSFGGLKVLVGKAGR